MLIRTLTIRAALLLAPLVLATALPAPASAQQSGTQPVETSTPWDPEQVPAQAAFDYGKAEPTLTCAPNKYCGIALQTGETVQSMAANEDHWSVTATVYGAGNLAKPVVLVTPWAPGLSDELTILTDKRTYRLKLVSDADKWTQLAVFRYPAGQ